MSDENEDGVVKLVDAGVPADHGLSSLGLLMQLAGSILAGYAAIMMLSMVFALRGSGQTMWLFLLIGMCVARSLMHRAAGSQLLYGNGQLSADGKRDYLGGVQRYIIFGATQSLAVGALMAGKFDLPMKFAAGITLGLLLWPATLFVIFQLPRFKRYKDDVPLTEDKGFEGASILMTMLGTCGALFSGALLFGMLEAGGALLKQGAAVLLVLAAAMLLVRSILHVQAGISGLRETSVDRSVELSNRYANFGIISSFCTGGAMLMFFISLMKGGGGDGAMIAIALVCGMCWLLLSWPLIVRRFFSDRQFADLLAGDEAPIHRRSPDAGLTGLGWLLFSHAIFGGSFIVMSLVGGDGEGGMFNAMTAFGPSGFRSIWFSVGLVVLQAWAGFELVRMSPQSRAIASVFGVVGAAVTLYINWPMLKMLKGMSGLLGRGGAELLQVAPMAIALVVPVLTLILVNRKIAPTARARFKPKPAPKA